MMTQDRWQKIKQVLSAARERPPAERRAFLDQTGESDSIRTEVESLLEHETGHATFEALGSLSGRTLLQYELQEEIGRGSSGVVYKALDTRLNRPVVIKVLPPILAADPDARRRFLREARCLSALNHPGIVGIYELAEDQGVSFLAMEYVPGRPLSEVIGPHGLSPALGLTYAFQIAEALSSAHKAGVIHRDLKPNNILITYQGQVKIADFGLAKTVNPVTTEPLTQTGTLLGTPGYMAPEQVREQPADERSDIFGFGAVLYQMLTGIAPFKRASDTETMAAILDKEPPAGDLPLGMGAVVANCLRKDPDQRFRSMAEVLLAMKSASASQPVPPTAKPPQQKRLLWFGAVAAALVAFFAFSGVRLGSGHVAADTAMQATLSEGMQRQKQLDFEGAIRAFTRVVDSSQDQVGSGIGRYYRGLAYTARVDAGSCLKADHTGCNREEALSDLRQSIGDFDIVLKTRPHHAGAHWNRGLAYAKLCHMESKSVGEAANSCDHAIADFTAALKTERVTDNFFSQLPDEAAVLLNRASTHLSLARLTSVPVSNRSDHYAAAIKDFNQLLSGGERFAHLVNKKRAIIQADIEAATKERKALTHR